ncbi:MAG TPA: Hsp70 family protein [Anaerolineaceae bacterium]|nr:Hsp70 family protein [Anaerolineaceae bacterium]HPN50632.1 Hsp70 family protein [Anaerolineaceae bacterium]
MPIAVGIDLGTTNSVVARMKKNTPRVIDNQNSDPLTPSVVYIDERGEALVGTNARAMGGKSPENTIFSIKRFMGRDFNDPVIQEDIRNAPFKVVRSDNGECEVIIRGRRYSPPEVSSLILKAMKEDAESNLDGETISHAVITVPAYFGNRQKEATRQAGILAGFKVMRIIPEPTAAALAYGLESDMDEPKTILVYDLGGGTFDVTVMLVAAGVFDDQGKTGDMHLGGDDFDRKIMEWIMEQVRIQHRVNLRELPNASEILFTLKQEAEQAKKRLSTKLRTPIVIPGLVRANNRLIDIECELSREEFNRMIQPFVTRSIELVYEAIRKANTTPEEINAVLLVGGSTKVPLVEESLRAIFGDRVIHGDVNPMLCVSQGAAIQTTLIPENELEGGDVPTVECAKCGATNLVGRKDCVACGAPMMKIDFLIQRIPVPIGVQLFGDKLEVILDDTMEFPTRTPVTKILKTSIAGQERVRLPIFEGREPVASANQFLGEVTGDLPPGLPEKTNVAVSFNMDADGILFVSASLPDRPGVNISARMDWKALRDSPRPIQPSTSERSSTSSSSFKEPEIDMNDWKVRAQFALFQAAAVKTEAEDLLPANLLSPVMNLASQLLMALQNENEYSANQALAQLEPLLENLGLFVMLGMARTISQNPDVAKQVGYDLIDQLGRYITSADRCKRNRDIPGLNKVVSDMMPTFEEVMKKLGGGMSPDVLTDLLSSSGTDRLK